MDHYGPIQQEESHRPMTCNAGHTYPIVLWDCPDPSHDVIAHRPASREMFDQLIDFECEGFISLDGAQVGRWAAAMDHDCNAEDDQ